MVAVGEHLGLVRQVGAAAVDQVDARQPVGLGDLLRAEMLLDRHRIVGAALHRRVVGDDHHLPPRDAADAGDHPRAGHLAVVEVAGGELADLEERRAGIEQPLDAIAGQQLAARDMALAMLLGAALRRLGDILAQLLGQRAVVRRAGARFLARQVDLACRAAVRSCLPHPRLSKPSRALRVASPMRLAKRRRTDRPRQGRGKCAPSSSPCCSPAPDSPSPLRRLPQRRERQPGRSGRSEQVGHRPRGDGQEREAGRRLLPLRQRHLVQEHGNPRRPQLDQRLLHHPAGAGKADGRADRRTSPSPTPRPAPTSASWPTMPRPSWTRRRSTSAPSPALKADIDRFMAIADKRALASAIGSTIRADIDPLNATDLHSENLFGIFVTQSMSDPAKNVPYLLQGGIGLPDRDYYLSSDRGDGQDPRRLPAVHRQDAGGGRARSMPRRGPSASMTSSARSPRRMRPSSRPRTATRPTTRGARPTSPRRRRASTGTPSSRAPSCRPSRRSSSGIRSRPASSPRWSAREPLEAWKDWLAFHQIIQSGPVLPSQMHKDDFAFFGTTLSGTPQERPRDKQLQDSLNALPWRRGRPALCRQIFPAVGKSRNR